MRFYIIVILFLTSCSSNDQTLQSVEIDIWDHIDQHDVEPILTDKNDLDHFTSALETKTKLDEDAVIATKPIATFKLVFADKSSYAVHYWPSSDNGGYVQVFKGKETSTYELDKSSVQTMNQLTEINTGTEVVFE
ncbi:hypothetical protein B0H94_11134 [Salsuginibacillus halophilus]|uniref:Uncharacterized protein n=1 Tax=Salsuginibacillus halophilus TaxID=517424 RepID=A0A2P8HAI8_9BACI|nr:hypothetical protein [Salsuginibacillus halophilus]PSL43211.1 hypothetical protein B0H94_11134 [Salsuginibacillus halophilus]